MNTTKNNSESKTSSHEKYIAFLKEQIEYYKTYHWDDEFLEENDVKEVFETMKDLMYEKKIEGNSFISILTDYLFERYGSKFGISYIMENIDNNIGFQSEEIINEYNTTESLPNDIMEAGWDEEFDINIEELIRKSSIRLDVEFGFPEETNIEMCSISHLFGNTYTEPAEDYNFDERILKNALIYLIHQQGYSVTDVLDKILADEDIDYDSIPDFVESVMREIINNPNVSTSLTACITANGMDICNLFDGYFNEENNLQINSSVRLGLFNDWDGGGSLFKIYLDRPFIISLKYVSNILIEKANNGDLYPVSEVYGVYDKKFWSDDFSITTEEPKLKEESKEDIDEYIRKNIKGED